MSDKSDELLINSLQDLKQDIRQLDTKFDDMHEILTKNTIVLVEHEKRSTASERRIEMLEEKQAELESDKNRLKGFFFYAGVIISTLGGLGALFHYWVEPFLPKK